jgi:hypothetical protein
MCTCGFARVRVCVCGQQFPKQTVQYSPLKPTPPPLSSAAQVPTSHLFCWLDYACVDQDDAVLKEVRELTVLCKPESDPDTFIMQYYCNTIAT